MKVKFKWGIKTFSGKGDDMVFNSCRNDSVCIGRDFTYPELTQHNHDTGAIMKNLAAVKLDAAAGYITDFGTYATRYQKVCPEGQLFPSYWALFVQMMYAWQKSDPTHIDLETVTVDDILLSAAPVKRVDLAIEAGFLPEIEKYDDLDTPIGV